MSLPSGCIHGYNVKSNGQNQIFCYKALYHTALPQSIFLFNFVQVSQSQEATLVNSCGGHTPEKGGAQHVTTVMTNLNPFSVRVPGKIFCQIEPLVLSTYGSLYFSAY